MTSLCASATPIFALSEQDLSWVERVRDGLTAEQKIAQLFVLSSRHDTIEEVDWLAGFAPGGVHRFPTHDLTAAWAATRAQLDRSEVPLILSGDIEGGMLSAPFATPIPNQMGIAACDDPDLTERLARIVGKESRALGYNWSFTPVVDINRAFRNAVVGTRSYGSDPDRIIRHAKTYIRALQAEGLAACAKHWPGDGIDDRDQHLSTSVNSLSMDKWADSFGRIFRSMIATGVMTIMTGHIALPAFVRARFPNSGREAFAPAAVSRLLNQELLREELGFGGVIVSDATVMGGLTSWMDRDAAVPAVIENGCDVFLFSREPREDMNRMLNGLREGRLSEARLEEAVTRMLSLKAALGLHRASPEERLPPLDALKARLATDDHRETARQAAGKSITLVKDTQALLPLDTQRHRRIVVIADEGWNFVSGAAPRSFDPLLDALTANGHEVRPFDSENLPTSDDCDLLLYLVGQEATPAISHIYLDFTKLHGGSRLAMVQFNCEIPTLLVSFGQPYYLYDAPNMSTYVNAYSALPGVQQELALRLFGQRPFIGDSPVDPFCGLEQLAW
ncbi:glycoside hydrolase family 3 protein [Sphingomonas sp.]|jgi:beta-N-acetylhexosaminidase|uniref:glycoside hydrolase family 3 protein n=1 Tax=Sphingomonas sp. TaxID=28214 RepID=UPI002E12C6E6|nr:glycoside hydrolase family 3 N-terminal domain-containing protein [Sphingomonas sp.]HEV7289949.1 glycoside hydrolase family 3 N-terminal domain-containing protein [Sphingomonas sp.]